MSHFSTTTSKLVLIVIVAAGLAFVGGCGPKKGEVAFADSVVKVAPPTLDSLTVKANNRSLNSGGIVRGEESVEVVGKGTAGVRAEVQIFGQRHEVEDSGDGVYRFRVKAPTPATGGRSERVMMRLVDPASEPSSPLTMGFTLDRSEPPTAGILARISKEMESRSVAFDFDSDWVAESEIQNVEALAKLVKEALEVQPGSKFVISGSCDQRGGENYNNALGLRRAIAVKNRMLMSDISPETLKPQSVGSTAAHDCKGLTGDSREECYSKDRRAVITFARP